MRRSAGRFARRSCNGAAKCVGTGGYLRLKLSSTLNCSTLRFLSGSGNWSPNGARGTCGGCRGCWRTRLVRAVVRIGGGVSVASKTPRNFVVIRRCERMSQGACALKAQNLLNWELVQPGTGNPRARAGLPNGTAHEYFSQDQRERELSAVINTLKVSE